MLPQSSVGGSIVTWIYASHHRPKQGWLECNDYLPFGDELLATSQNGRSGISCYNADLLRQKFTGYERDSESRLDFAQARYYSWAGGRFQSPDELFVDQFSDNSQSWNLYAYVRNNPLSYTDPTGLCRQRPDGRYEDSDGEPCVRPEDRTITVTAPEPVLLDPLQPEKLQALAHVPPEPLSLIDLPGQFFVGFGDAILNEKPIGVLRAGVAVGVQALAVPFALGRLGQAIQEIGVFKNTPVVINWSHRIMEARPGHLPPTGTQAEVQQAVEGAVRTGKYVFESASGVFKGTVRINGIANGFEGRIVSGIARISSVWRIR